MIHDPLTHCQVVNSAHQVRSRQVLYTGGPKYTSHFQYDSSIHSNRRGSTSTPELSMG